METEQELSRACIEDRLLPGPGIIVSRGLVYVSMGLLAAAVTWSWSCELDIVLATRARLVVRGQPIRITAPEPSLVVEVPVRIGQQVEEGEVLLKLDSSGYRSEGERLEMEIATLEAEGARHSLAARAVLSARTDLEWEEKALETMESLARGEVENIQALLADGIASLTDLKQHEAKLVEAQARRARAQYSLRSLDRDAVERERLSVEAAGRARALRVSLVQLRERADRATLRAPVAGMVTHLAVVHAGSVLGTSEPAVVLVPRGQPLQAALSVPNSSMRRLSAGLNARLVLDAFPAEDHGYLEGTIAEVEPEADSAGNYTAWLNLEREETAGSRFMPHLRAGLLGEARIIVERRRVADFLLRPFRKLGRGLMEVE